MSSKLRTGPDCFSLFVDTMFRCVLYNLNRYRLQFSRTPDNLHYRLTRSLVSFCRSTRSCSLSHTGSSCRANIVSHFLFCKSNSKGQSRHLSFCHLRSNLQASSINNFNTRTPLFLRIIIPSAICHHLIFPEPITPVMIQQFPTVT